MAPVAPATPVSPPPLALDHRLIQGNLREHTRYQAGSGQGASITGGCLPRAPSSQHIFGEGMWTREHIPLHPDSRGRCRAPSNLRRRSALAPDALSIIRSRESEPCCWAAPTKRMLGTHIERHARHGPATGVIPDKAFPMRSYLLPRLRTEDAQTPLPLNSGAQELFALAQRSAI